MIAAESVYELARTRLLQIYGRKCACAATNYTKTKKKNDGWLFGFEVCIHIWDRTNNNTQSIGEVAPAHHHIVVLS